MYCDAELQEQVGKAHDPQADLAGLEGAALDLLQGKFVGVDDVVQEMDGGVHHVRQFGVIDGAVFDRRGQIERAQVAGLVGQQGLLAAGVGGLDLAQLGHGVAAVDRVQEDDAGLAGGPGALDDEVEEGRGLDLLATSLPERGLTRGKSRSSRHRLHEGVGQAHGDVEVGEALGVASYR